MIEPNYPAAVVTGALILLTGEAFINREKSMLARFSVNLDWDNTRDFLRSK
jgi:hypothetical protein